MIHGVLLAGSSGPYTSLTGAGIPSKGRSVRYPLSLVFWNGREASSGLRRMGTQRA